MFSRWKDNLSKNLCSFSSFFVGSMAKIATEYGSEYVGYDDACKSVSSTSKTVMPITLENVNAMIASDTVVIFSKKSCPYCKMAKEVFDKLNKKYTAIELDERDDGSEIQSILGKLTGASTVPRVFVKGEFLGGGTDIRALYEKGELEKKF